MNHSYPRIHCSPGKHWTIESCENCGQKRIRYRKGGVYFLTAEGRASKTRPAPCSKKAMQLHTLAMELNQMVQFYEASSNR